MTEADRRMIPYLLGELAEAEQQQLEREFFDDSRLFEQLTTVETDLVDDYVRGRLTPEVRTRFETVYLADPRRRERVHIAEALIASIDERGTPADTIAPRPSPARMRWTLTWSLATTAAVLAAVTIGLLVETARLRRGLDDMQSARTVAEQRERALQDELTRERAQAAQALGELERLRAAPPSPLTSSIVSLLVTLRASRGADADAPPMITIEPATKEVRIDTALERASYSRYRLSLTSVAGRTVVVREHVRADGTSSSARLRVTVPADSLAAGDYVLTVSGETPDGPREDIGKSLIRVTRR